MRLFILALLVTVSVCAYPYPHPKHNFDIALDNVEYKNIAKFKDPISVPVSPALAERLKYLKDGDQDSMNQYADQIIASLQDFFIHEGYDPVEMPDLHTGFNYTLIITYHGELDLTQGWLQDLSTLHRSGDVSITGTDTLEIVVPIAYDDLQFTYDYSAKIMGLGPTGGIYGKYSSLSTQVKFSFDPKKLVITFEQFYITHSGFITIHFNGNPLVDWLLNLLSDVSEIILKEAILLRTEDIVRGAMQGIVDKINDYLSGLTTVASYS